MRQNNSWTKLGSIILIIWALACLTIFMYYPGAINQIQDATLYDYATLPEKLARISIVKYILDTIVSIIGVLFYGTACISVGTVISPIFHLNKLKNNDPAPILMVLIPTYFLLGNVIFSVVFLTLATVSRLSTTLSFVILIIGFLSGLINFRNISIPKIQIKVGYEKFLGYSSLTLLIISIFQSSARLSYDASSMYLSVAKLTAIENIVSFYMEKGFPASVLHSVIQSSAIIQIFGDQTARMTTWLFGATIIAVAVSLAQVTHSSSLARQILPILILTSTAFFDQLGDGKVDLIGTSYSLASIFWLIKNAEHQQNNKYLSLLTGFLIGFACILRPHNTFLLGIFVFIYIFQKAKFNRDFFSSTVSQLGWLAVGAIGFAIYHLVVNASILHSPYAFLDSFTNISPTDGPWDYQARNVLFQKLLYPFVVTFKNSGASLGNITPLVVVFLPFLFIYDVRKNLQLSKEAVRLFITASSVLLIWILIIFSVVEVRYVLSLWIIIFIFVAEIIASIIRTQMVILRIIVTSSTLVLIGFIFIRSLFVSISTYSPINSHGNPICFDTEHCQIITSINHVANQGDRVLTLSGLRYYLREDLFACSTNHNEFSFFQNIKPNNTEYFWLEVYRRGYKFIAFEEGYVTDSAQIQITPSPKNTPAWITLEPIFGKIGDTKIAYQINVNNPPIEVEWSCKKNESSDKWTVNRTGPE